MRLSQIPAFLGNLPEIFTQFQTHQASTIWQISAKYFPKNKCGREFYDIGL
ncbi:MAG: hypothetical protein ACJAWV_004462 [Flammeovirgaceae bacterium]|jgi:hypothetical protein